MENTNREMDLFELFDRIGGVIAKMLLKFINSIIWFIRFNVKNWVVILISILLGTSLAYYSMMPENRKHYSEFIIQVNGTNSFTVYDIVKSLSNKLDDESNIRFADSIRVSPEVAKSVKDLDPYYVIDLNNNGTRDYIDYNNSFKEDTLNSRMSNCLAIQYKVKGNAEDNKLQLGLINYLRRNKFLKQEETKRKESIKSEMDALQKEIYALDSLRETGNNSMPYALTIDKARIISKSDGFSEEILTLQKRLLNLKQDMDLRGDVVAFYSAPILRDVRSPFFIYSTRIVGLYLIGFLLSLLFRQRRRIVNTLKG